MFTPTARGFAATSVISRVAFFRCMNIPARYVTGYMGDIGVPVVLPMDFSGWFEAYLGGRWYTFDARHNKPRIGRIVMAIGTRCGGCRANDQFRTRDSEEILHHQRRNSGIVALTEQRSSFLLLAQRDHGIDLGRSSSGKEAGEQGDDRERKQGCAEGRKIDAPTL